MQNLILTQVESKNNNLYTLIKSCYDLLLLIENKIDEEKKTIEFYTSNIINKEKTIILNELNSKSM